MNYTLIIGIVFFISIGFSSQTWAQYVGTGSNYKTTKVKPYVKKDGTFVKEHKRTKTNSYNLDNYKAKNNYNPYTSKVGTKKYKSPYNSLNKSSYKSTLPKINSSYKIKTYKPKKFKIK